MSDLYFRQADEEGCLFTKIRGEREGRRREVEIKAFIGCLRSLYGIYAFYEAQSAANNRHLGLVLWANSGKVYHDPVEVQPVVDQPRV